MRKILFILPMLGCFIFANAQAQNGIYLTVDGGFAQQDGLPSQDQANATNVTTSHSPNAIRGGVGYNHDFNSLFGIGLEIGAGQYGKTTYDYANGGNTKIVSDTVEFLGVSTFHIQQFDVMAKLGGLRLTPKVTGENAPSGDTQIRLEAAIEGAYNITPHFAVTLTYAHVFGDQIDSLSNVGTNVPSVNEELVGLRYIFGS